jgi:hypothetical protein
MGARLFQAKYEIATVEYNATNPPTWTLSGEVIDYSPDSFAGADASVGDLIFDESPDDGVVNRWRITYITAAGEPKASSLSVIVVYDETGTPAGAGEPVVCNGAICSKTAIHYLSQAPSIEWTNISESLSAAILNTDLRIIDAIPGGGATGPQGFTGPQGAVPQDLPAGKIVAGAQQHITSASDVQILLGQNTGYFDTDNMTATANQITIKTAGYYIITGSIFNMFGSANITQAILKLNGNEIARHLHPETSNMQVSTTIYCQINDVITLWANTFGGESFFNEDLKSSLSVVACKGYQGPMGPAGNGNINRYSFQMTLKQDGGDLVPDTYLNVPAGWTVTHGTAENKSITTITHNVGTQLIDMFSSYYQNGLMDAPYGPQGMYYRDMYASPDFNYYNEKNTSQISFTLFTTMPNHTFEPTTILYFNLLF